jgi:hypothetical protein
MSLSDGNFINNEQRLQILFNKYFSLPTTDDNQDYFLEELNLRNRSFVLPSKQIWANDIPDTAPNFQFSDEDAILGGTNPIPGVTTPTDYSHIKKYLTLEFEVVGSSNGKSYKLSTLIDSIPFNYDSAGSYKGVLYRNDGVTEIPFGPAGGNWLLDHDSGILTFFTYNNVSSFVNENNPPKITFYRYEGNKGLDPGITSSVPETALKIFNGGDTSGSADTLAAVLIDERAVGSFTTSALSMSLNFGNFNEGSWRIAVRGGGVSNPEQSKLVFQKRDSGGTWTTKFDLE